jgi:shikimate dehydrogenase
VAAGVSGATGIECDTPAGRETDLKMGFVGVRTAGSSIMKVFPRWAEVLGLPTRRLSGHDLPLDASDDDYRSLVTAIRDDPGHLGALVTTHKIRVFQGAGDLFAELDEFARLCGEISSISKEDGRLIGHAKDPVTAGLALEEFLPAGHFAATGAEVVCLGAGGAGTALTWYLAGRADRPSRILCTDTSAERLGHLRAVHVGGGLDPDLFRYVRVGSATDGDRLVADSVPGSLIVNATGLGKDRPGSPLTDEAAFPEGGFVWELNYRGELDLLRQARAQRDARGLTVIDGWRYFIHGWTQVIAEVFHIPLDGPAVERLAAVAQELR